MTCQTLPTNDHRPVKDPINRTIARLESVIEDADCEVLVIMRVRGADRDQLSIRDNSSREEVNGKGMAEQLKTLFAAFFN